MTDPLNDDLQEPLGRITADAVQTHEVFEAYVNAGFTRPEALTLVQALLQIIWSMTLITGQGDK